MKTKNGFTIIELIVVLAIISVLSAIVSGNVRTIIVKARDARRVAEVRQMQKALDAYYADHGSFPTSGWACSNNSSWPVLQTTLAAYLPVMPVDPTNTNSCYSYNINCYTYCYFSANYGKGENGCDWYMIVYNLENASGADPGVRSCPYTGYPEGYFFRYGGSGSNTVIKTIGKRVPL